MLRIYDSLTRRVRTFEPLVAGKVSIYVCGQTVYDVPHLGHARKDVGFDVIIRWLEASGYQVTYVRNFTDIDDKIIVRAADLGEPIGSLTERMIGKTSADYRALGLREPDHEPRATHYVPEMIALAEQLQVQGAAYCNEDLFYSVRSFPAYGKLSGRSPDNMRAGARVDPDGRKRDPLDFVLWKSSKPYEHEDAIWQSPWGPGRPGWHLECSAMARSLLGDTIDIHGGGPDLRFPHHENEIAQSEAANHAPFARWWMHVGQLNVGGKKMAKSSGNAMTLQQAIEVYGGDVVRFCFARSHYRSRINFTEASLTDAAAGYQRLVAALNAGAGDGKPLDWEEVHAVRLREAMDADFNSPAAISVLFELAATVRRDRSPALSRQLTALAAIFNIKPGASDLEAQVVSIEAAIARRVRARNAGDFVEADQIRAELAGKGIDLEDTPSGTLWRQRG